MGFDLLANLTNERGSVAKLSKSTGIPDSTVRNWIRRKTMPSGEDAVKVAEYFNITIDQLMGRENAAPKGDALPKGAIPYHSLPSLVPVVGVIPAGNPMLATEDIIGYEPTDVKSPAEYFWLIVKGDSMINAGIRPGDMVLVHQQPCADDGQIVACRVNGDEATLKRIKSNKDCIMLIPENQAYEPRIVQKSDFESGYASIIGVVVELKRKFA